MALKLAFHPSLHGLQRSAKPKFPSNRAETGNITGKQGIPYSYRKTNTIHAAIRLGGKVPRNFVTGSSSEPASIKNFLKVLPR